MTREPDYIRQGIEGLPTMADRKTREQVIQEQPVFEFDRYVNGALMSEGVKISGQNDLAGAVRGATRLADAGDVLVLRTPAPDDITYLLARVATLKADLNQQFIDQDETVWTHPTAEAYALTCKALHAAKATNAQRDARLVRAGVMAAALKSIEYGDCNYGCNEGIADAIRALATDDAAIQAAVEGEK